MPTVMSRRVLLLGATSAILAACATRHAIILDRDAMAGVKRIGLPTVGVPRSPDVRVVNGISERMAGLGLIGAIGQISGSVVRGNRSDAVVRMMADQGFDPGPAMTAMLANSLAAKGFTVVPIAADPKRKFLPAQAVSADYDVLLDCYVLTYGFTALDDKDETPYRATAIVGARLTRPGGTVLMDDTVTISATGDSPAAPSGSAAQPLPAGSPMSVASGTFLSFSDAEKDPAGAVAALRTAFEAAAAGVIRRAT